MNIRAFAVAVALLSLLSLANAAYIVRDSEWTGTVGRYATAVLACQARVASASGWTYSSTGAATGSAPARSAKCYAVSPSGGAAVEFSTTFEACPSGASAVSGQCRETVASCPAGRVLQPSGECTLTPCAAAAGTTKEVNFTLGWTRTANADDYGFVGGLATIPTSACHGGCTVGVLTSQRTWVSPVASPEGLYRHSADLLVIGTDSACTVTTTEASPTTPDKPCDGSVGYINGKRTCVKSSSSPDPVAPATSPEKIGNPTAGSAPNPTDANNPAGREPTGGTGGNLGGPPSGASAGQPRGTGTGPVTGGAGGGQTIKVEIPDLKDPCGIPGSPPCKIDETGMPEPPDLDAEQAAEDALAAAKDFAEDPTGALPAHPGLNWTFSLPSGCSAIPVSGFGEYITSIDICEWQPLFHELMSIVWVMGGLFGAISHFFRNVYSQG